MARILKNLKNPIKWFSGRQRLPRGRTFRFLTYSPEAKEFVRKNSGVLLEAHRLINENLLELLRGEPVSNKEKTITIKKAATGSSKGERKFFSAKVTVKENYFFLKIVNQAVAREIMEASDRMEKLLQKTNYKINGITVRQIKPHIVYENWMQKMTFVVTDFFEETQVVQVSDMPKTIIKRKIETVLEQLWRKTDRQFPEDPLDISTKNAFYNKKTRTILLYDFF